MGAASKLVDVIKNQEKFAEKLRSVAKLASSVLGTFIITTNVILAFLLRQPSAVLVEMRKSFEEVNLKLDHIKIQIDQLRNHIEWDNYKTSFERYAIKINTLSAKAHKLFRNYEPNTGAFIDKKIRYG